MFDNELLSSISQLSGYLSLTIWLFAQLPQIIENYMNRSVEGVNVLFLSSWIAGDVSNLTGCLLTKAMPFQILISSYYCFIDVILSFQYYYYTRIYPYHKTQHNLLQSPNMVREQQINENTMLLPSDANGSILNSRTPRHGSSRRSSFLSKIMTTGLIAKSVKKTSAAPVSSKAYANVQSSPVLSVAKSLAPVLISAKMDNFMIGRIAAWVCTFFYLSARLPQIKTNYTNKSTSGISPYLFLFAMLGNSFYTISILADLKILQNNHDSSLQVIIWDQLPFLCGSGGTVLFDLLILSQCWYYGRPRRPVHQRSIGHLQTGIPNLRKKNSGPVNGAFQKPDWYLNKFQYEDEEDEPYNFSSFIESPPPHHYISGSYTNSNLGQKSSNGLPVSSMTTFSFSRPKSIHKMARSTSSSLHSPIQTNLIPSIINSYSLVSKKMEEGGKRPFSPSDFLNDDFHTPVENSSFSLDNN